MEKYNLRVAEKRLLLMSNEKNIQMFDVKIGSNKKDYIHVIHGGRKENAIGKVVLLPGYGGGAALFYPIFEYLTALGYEYYAVDWIGTGLSGRTPFIAKNNKDTIQFFIEPLHRLVKHLFMGQSITIIAHSMGAYLALEFARRFPTRVKQLLLIAPAGLSNKKINPSGPIINFIWNMGITPGFLVRNMGWIGKYALYQYCMNKFYKCSRQDIKLIHNFLYNVMCLNDDPSGEAALRHILQPMVWSPHSWENALMRGEIKTQIRLIYAEDDPLDYREGIRLCGRKNVGVIPYGGHFPWLNCRYNFVLELIRSLK